MNSRPKILAVDDKPENLVAIERVLRNLDVEIVKATSGNEALKATLHHDFVLALLDIQMPEMDGYELASLLQEEEKTRSLPFIFISAVYTDHVNIFKGYEKGAFSFITKPFQAEILINKVKFFVEKHQQEQLLQDRNLELQLINEELESFSYSVSHDLRAPLRALTSYSEILEEDFAKTMNDESRKLLASIRKNARKMGQIIDDLLSLSKIGRRPLDKVKVDMHQVVQLLINEINQTTPHNARVDIARLEPAFVDPGLIHQVWTNLISNAIKYSAKKADAHIRIYSETDHNGACVYVVKDNGAGFNMKYANDLFGVFQRLHHASEYEGTGVGLAIVQRIVQKHGGSVWCEAEEGSGATFYFSLPNHQN